MSVRNVEVGPQEIVVVQAAIFADGLIHAERRLCTACLSHVKDRFAQPATWLDTAITR